MATESRARRPIRNLVPETEKKPATLRLVTALLGLGAERTKMLACAHPAFDGPVILFQDIIEILHGTVFRVLV